VYEIDQEKCKKDGDCVDDGTFNVGDDCDENNHDYKELFERYKQ